MGLPQQRSLFDPTPDPGTTEKHARKQVVEWIVRKLWAENVQGREEYDFSTLWGCVPLEFQLLFDACQTADELYTYAILLTRIFKREDVHAELRAAETRAIAASHAAYPATGSLYAGVAGDRLRYLEATRRPFGPGR